MKVLAVMGSPRRGDSYGLTRRVERHLTSIDDYEFDYLWLRDADIGFCRGCYACLTRGEQHCPLDDDVPEIEKRLLASDGVIFASGVYAMGMTALLKNLLDRLAYTMHRPRFFDQKTLLIVSAGAIGVGQTIKAMRAVGICGFDVIDAFGFVTPPGDATPTEERAMETRSAQAAKRLHEAIQRGRYTRPSLMDVMTFRIQQRTYEILKDVQTADYEYFAERGWLSPQCRYYVDAPVGIVKDAIARGAAWMVGRRLQRRQEHSGGAE